MFKVFNDVLENLLKDCDKLFYAKVWQSIADVKSLIFISKIAWVVTAKMGVVPG